MRYLRSIGAYLLIVAVALFLLSLWQIKFGSGHADLSFLIIVPFAVGLLFGRKWALWGTGILGAVLTALVLCFAVVHSVAEFSGLTVSLGPVVLLEPSALSVWAFALIVVLLLGLPMLSVFMKENMINRSPAQPAHLADARGPRR